MYVYTRKVYRSTYIETLYTRTYTRRGAESIFEKGWGVGGYAIVILLPPQKSIFDEISQVNMIK